MRIAHLALGYPPDVGGSERWNAEVARRLAERGHDLRVYTWSATDRDGALGRAGEGAAKRGAGREREGAPGDGVPGAEAGRFAALHEAHGADAREATAREASRGAIVPVTRAPEAPPATRAGVAAMVRWLAGWEPDVVLAARGSRVLGRAVAAAGRVAPVVLCMHDLRRRHEQRGRVAAWRVRRRYGLDHATRVVASSDDTRQRLLALGVPAQRVVRIHPGVEAHAYRPDPELGRRLRAAHGWGERPVLLTVARLVAGKGHERVIDALPRLRETAPDVLYGVVGSGPRRAELEARAARLGVAAHVHFTGFVDDVAPYYQACDVFVMPSSPPSEAGGKAGEGFGLAYVEAAACGKPVVAARTGAAAEVVDDGRTGLLVDPRDPAALPRALERLLTDPAARIRMGAAARDHALGFDWRRTTRALEAVLAGAAGAHADAGPRPDGAGAAPVARSSRGTAPPGA